MKKEHNLWPAAIIVLAFSFIAITGWSIYRATSGVSSVTDPRYYSHGLKYNNTSIETIAAETMGWAIEASLSENIIELLLTDKNGAAISGCKGSITFSANPLSTDVPKTIDLEDLGKGRYRAPLPDSFQKNTAASISLNKGQATIHRNLLINR